MICDLPNQRNNIKNPESTHSSSHCVKAYCILRGTSLTERKAKGKPTPDGNHNLPASFCCKNPYLLVGETYSGHT